MIEINRHIESLLLSNDCVIVPGLGGFMAHHVDAHYDDMDNVFLPPLRTVGFNPQLTMNDSLLVLSYVETYDLSYPEALRRIEDEVVEIKQTLENEGKYEVDNIGMLSLNEDGNIVFAPCEAGILTPGLYGLGRFEMMPLAFLVAETGGNEQSQKVEEQSNNGINVKTKAYANAATNGSNTLFIDDEDNEVEDHAEFISIKKTWIRNVAAACIAIIAFFAFSSPLGTPNVIQKSQIDTGMLTKIMPKEVHTIEKGGDLLLPSAKIQQAMGTTSVTNAQQVVGKPLSMSEDCERLDESSSYYSIVLASRITKRNAAAYAEQLQSKGYKEARALITENDVKVIFGNFRTENEAYCTLNKLHKDEAFSDGWITRVKE